MFGTDHLYNITNIAVSTYRGGDAAHILHRRFILMASKDLRQPIVVVLAVAEQETARMSCFDEMLQDLAAMVLASPLCLASSCCCCQGSFGISTHTGTLKAPESLLSGITTCFFTEPNGHPRGLLAIEGLGTVSASDLGARNIDDLRHFGFLLLLL